MGCKILLVFVGLALTTSDCDGSGGGGALRAAPEGSAVIVQTSFRSGAAVYALAAVGDGDALLVWLAPLPDGRFALVSSTLVASSPTDLRRVRAVGSHA